ncbi:hypothetical protein Sinac_3052 [Singulisphaera acidiphila DSM 18658]|uniref:Uncharacterized protein n=1 Tax=Singulisphaera acidiphila (strain ATCC BAA-1392 / DSM 18658 / VKM B-2454 / MOB10) TaxID=886293 RepID=L0DET4_SINAD|nr:hypothetical protein Sinac_3052 [Singulisphaera acidiphila DSM 18658]
MPKWEEKRTDETRKIEALFHTNFPKTDAYRFNSASIRVRVIDERFEGKSIAEREALVLPLLKKVPKKTTLLANPDSHGPFFRRLEASEQSWAIPAPVRWEASRPASGFVPPSHAPSNGPAAKP